MTNISNFVCQACFLVWPPRQTLLDKHILLVNFQNVFCLSQAENVCQAHVCVMAKLANTALDKQNLMVCQTLFVLLAGVNMVVKVALIEVHADWMFELLQIAK